MLPSRRPYDIHGAWPKRMELSSIQTSAIFPEGTSERDEYQLSLAEGES